MSMFEHFISLRHTFCFLATQLWWKMLNLGCGVSNCVEPTGRCDGKMTSKTAVRCRRISMLSQQLEAGH